MTTNYRVIERQRRDQLGEGLNWSAKRGDLFWVDILAPALHAYNLATGHLSTWDMPEAIGWALERAGRDDFVIGLRSGFATLSLEPFHISAIGSPEPDRPYNRLNDAKTDSCGRIWAGSLDERDEEPLGALYRLDPDLTWSRRDEGYVVTNGPTFSVDGRTLYHADTLARTVYAFTLTDEGELLDKRIFLRFDQEWGYPDGMTTDVEGGVWIAHWDGARVSRFDPEGNLDRSIALPASRITNCVFAGDRLDRMFVTSAAKGRADEPFAGALFEIDPGTCGVAPTAFAG